MRIDVAFDAAAARAEGPESVAISEVVTTAEAIAIALRESGHDARLLPLDEGLTTQLRASDADVIFNLVESLRGQSALEPAAAWLYELEGRAYTGAPATALDRCLHKAVTRAILRDAGVSLPAGRALRPGDDSLDGLPFPLLLKPAAEDASHGIDLGSVVHDEASAHARIASLRARFGEVVIAEAWIDGRELNVSILESGGELRVLPAAEIDFSEFPPGAPRILTYAAKWDETSDEYRGSPSVTAELDEGLRVRVEDVARRAFRALGLRGYGRVDLRIDAKRTPYVIDVNPNPALAPDAGFARAAERAGISYAELVATIVTEAAARGPRRATAASTDDGAVTLVPLRAEHRASLLELVRATNAFREDEIAVAAELLDDGFRSSPSDPIDPKTESASDDYRFVVAEHEGRAVGYACFGLASLSDGVFDLYWIVVDPTMHGRGVGRALLRAAERAARSEGGRWLVAETSGMPSYEATRAFYRAAGYVELGRLPEFYRVGDDKISFGRSLRT